MTSTDTVKSATDDRTNRSCGSPGIRTAALPEFDRLKTRIDPAEPG